MLFQKLLLSALIFLYCGCTDSSKEKESRTDQPPVIEDPVSSPDTKVSSNEQGDSVSPTFNASAVKKIYDSFPVNIAGMPAFNLYALRGLKISVAYSGLRRLRFLSRSPEGRLFATDMFDRSDNKKGRVYIFDNWNPDSMKFESVKVYLDNLHNPNQVAFYDKYIYVAETGKLTRYLYRPLDDSPASQGEVIATFPDYGLSYKYGGWHLTRSLAFHNNKLYVSIGSSCNACIEKEEVRASIMEMDPDGKNAKVFAKGLRNSVGIKWIGNRLWATGMGRDLIGPDRPEDLFQEIQRDEDYGWPYYYQFQNRIYEDPEFKDSARRIGLNKPPVAFAGFKAHSAPLGFEFMRDLSHPDLNNSILVCLHGSTSVWRQRGNSIVKLEGGNKYTEIITGFLKGKSEDTRLGRPCDIMINDKNSFYFTDDLNGVLYYVSVVK